MVIFCIQIDTFGLLKVNRRSFSPIRQETGCRTFKEFDALFRNGTKYGSVFRGFDKKNPQTLPSQSSVWKKLAGLPSPLTGDSGSVVLASSGV